MTAGLAVVVGDVINDVVVRPLGPPVADSDTPSKVKRTLGGSGANQAAWMAALGVRVRFAGRAGSEDVEVHRVALADLGVDVRISADDDHPTGSIVVLIGPNGARSMYTDRGASAWMDAGDVPPGLVSGAALLQLSGYAFFAEPSREVVRDLWDSAREAGVQLTVDPGSVVGLAAVGRDDFLAWTSGAAAVFPNLDEGRFLAGGEADSSPDQVAEALLSHYDVVALTLGSDGVLVKTRGGERVLRPAPEVDVLDPTGAGDAFCAGYLAAYLAGGSIIDCVDLGLGASAQSLAMVGGRPPQALAV